MKKWPQRFGFGLAVVAGLLAVASVATAAKCELSLKKIESNSRSQGWSASNIDWLFAHTDSQNFWVQFQPKVEVRDGKEKKTWITVGADSQRQQFKKLVKKEPKYNAKIPFRNIAQLGDKKYAFALDAPSADGDGFGLLYFDRNGNGDLTDDGVVESNEAKEAREAEEKAANKEKKAEGKKKKSTPSRTSYRRPNQATFPPIDMQIEVGGKETEYRFFLSGYSVFQPQYGYASISITPGVYYEGEIELDGRKQRVVLVDYNSNGRFDNATKIAEYGRGPKGPQQLYAQQGDVLFIDPKPLANPNLAWNPSGIDFRYNVEKLVCLDGHYYDLKVSPSGNELSIEPSDIGLGYIKNPNANYTAILHGDDGIVKVKGTKDEPIAVPEGKWRLLSYTIDLTNVKPDEDEKEKKEKEAKAAEKKEKKKTNLWAAIGKAMAETTGTAGAVSPNRPKTNLVSAAGTTDCKPVEVKKGETVVMPFGPPYRTTVEPSYFESNSDQLHLGLAMFGSAGEVLDNIEVDGGRPGKPKIKILAPDDKVVAEGNFEYG